MGFFQVELIYRPVDDISSGQSCILSGEEVRGNTVRRKKTENRILLRNCNLEVSVETRVLLGGSFATF